MKQITRKNKILCVGGFDGFDSLKKKLNIYLYKNIYQPVSGINKYYFKIDEHRIGYSHMNQWYGEWKYKVKDVDTVILSDGIRGRDVIEYIHEKNPDARIIVYYMNSIYGHERNEPSRYKNLPCELFTFDKYNAEMYDIRFKHYYYPYMNQRGNTVDLHCNQDIFFIGEDKGRLGDLVKLKNDFENNGFKCKFLILKTKHKFYFMHRHELISEPIPYDEVVKEIKQSRAILDFTQSRQHGLTYRPMEAMCFQKKLITNFEEITDYNFYNPKNIFRLSHDNINDLKSFLEQPYEPVDDSIREEYVAANWLDSFFQ